jgi:adenosylmethionine-8-amino-7-oxononanoate aminotransferase
LLIIDEVFTGFGRCGSFFASTAAGIAPDIVTMSKGMTGGYIPMGATVVSEHIYAGFRADRCGHLLRYGHTTSGHAVGSAVALAAVDLLRGGVIDSAADAASWLRRNFPPAFSDLPGVVEARTYGVVGVIEMTSELEAQTVVARALHAGVIVRSHGTAVMLVPALTVNENQLAEMTAGLRTAAGDCH